jgi:hypothetical protein
MLLLGKTACGARPSQTNRRGLRLQAQPGFAAPSCARRRPRKTPVPVPDADALPVPDADALPVPDADALPVPDADALPALCMHGINKKGLPAKTGKPFLFIQWWRRRESNLP